MVQVSSAAWSRNLLVVLYFAVSVIDNHGAYCLLSCVKKNAHGSL